MRRCMRCPRQAVLDQRLQRVHRRWLSMHQTQAPRGRPQRSEPPENLAAVGVCRHRIDFRDRGVGGDASPVNPNFPRTVDELLAASACGLITDKKYRVSLIWKRRGQVVQHAAAGGHAARRDHDSRAATRCELLGLLRGGDCLETRGRERVHLTRGGSQVRVEFSDTRRVVPECLRRHRAVHIDRQHGNPMLSLQAAQPVEHLLDASDREGRDHQFAAAGGRALDYVRQLRARIIGLVITITVGRFHEHNVGGDGVRRVGKDRPVVTTEIPTKENGGTPVKPHDHEGRSE